jgi:hypothetical protein
MVAIVPGGTIMAMSAPIERISDKQGMCPECGWTGPFTIVPLPKELGGGRFFLICKDCAAVAEVTREPDSENPDFLKCIPFEGIGSDTPTGKIGDYGALRTARNYRIKYVTATGRQVTWMDFVKQMGRDPELLLQWRNEELAAEGKRVEPFKVTDAKPGQKPFAGPFKIG